MEFVRSKLPTDKRVLNKDLTIAVVFSIYRAINDKDRPMYDNNFTEKNPNGECLHHIIDQIFRSGPDTFFTEKDEDSLNFFNR